MPAFLCRLHRKEPGCEVGEHMQVFLWAEMGRLFLVMIWLEMERFGEMERGSIEKRTAEEGGAGE